MGQGFESSRVLRMEGRSEGKRMPDNTSTKGQSKSHLIFNADGTPVLNEDGSQLEMTQAEWRSRDKSLGYTRAEDEVVEVAPEVPSEGEETVG